MELENKWILWYHSVQNNNWDKNSYALLNIYSTVDDVCQLKSLLSSLNLYKNKMLFLMRKRENFIYPSWEDKHNINGGTLCFVGNEDIINIFFKLFYQICSESLYSNKKLGNEHINGISISDKGNKKVLKIWYSTIPFKNETKNYIKLWDTNSEIYKLLINCIPYFVYHKVSKLKDTNLIKKTKLNNTKRYYKNKWR